MAKLLERRTSLSLADRDKVLIYGLMHFYGLSKEAVRDIFRILPGLRTLAISTIGERIADINQMPTHSDYKNILSKKQPFDSYLKAEFNKHGIDSVEIVKKFLIERRRFSNEEKSLIVGFNRYFSLKGVSIGRLFAKVGRTVNPSNLKKMYERPEKEVSKYYLFSNQEEFELAAVEYFGFQNKDEMYSFIETLKDKEQTRYTDNDRKLAYGLTKYANLDSATIARLMNAIYSDRFESLTSSQISLLRMRVVETEIAKVTREEVEEILGVNLDEMRVIYGDVVANEKQSYSPQRIRVILGFLRYVASRERGSIEMLRRFMVRHFNYNEASGRPYTLVKEFEKKSVQNKDLQISRDEFEKEISLLGYKSIEEVRDEFDLSKSGNEEQKGDISRIVSMKKFEGTAGVDKLLSSILKFSIGESIGTDIPINIRIFTPAKNDSRSLLRAGDREGMGLVLRIRIIVFEESQEDSVGLRIKKRCVKGLTYVLSKSGQLEKILNFVRGKGVNTDGAILEVYTMKRNNAETKELALKVTYVHPNATLDKV